jgi:hypothetical protein
LQNAPGRRFPAVMRGSTVTVERRECGDGALGVVWLTGSDYS